MTAQGGTRARPFLIAIACMVVAAVAGAAGLFYIGHRVKRAVVDKARSYGVELPGTSAGGASGAPARLPKACDLLSRQEASSLLGEPVERVEGESDTCGYYGPPGLSARLASEQAAITFKAAQTPSSQVGGTEVATAVDQLANSLGTAQGRIGSGGEMPLVLFVVTADGKAQMAAISASGALFGGIFRASGAQGAKFTEEVAGLGDRAIRLPKLGLNVLQGEVLIRVIPGPIPAADAKTIAVARAVLMRLQ
jgi:hypothetical protein